MPCPPYFAYGSNMHPLRLGERTPSCRVRGVAELPSWRLCFHKQGADDSAKCNIIHSGEGKDRVFGVVYNIAAEDKPALDRAERGYHTATVNVLMAGRRLEVFTYLADEDMVDDARRPFAWYLDMVLCGAAHHHLPENYIRNIAGCRVMADMNIARRQDNMRRLEAMRAFTAGRERGARAASRQH